MKNLTTLTGTTGQDTLTTHDPDVTRIIGLAGDDYLDTSIRGGSAYGGSGNDTLIGGGGGTRQAHLYGGDGDDVFYLNTGNVQAPYGDHVFGGEGADVFHFTTRPGDTARITGRLDDFDPSRDSIHLNGLKLDFNNLPANVRIVEHLSQPWILIDNRILYALEGARQFATARATGFGLDVGELQVGNDGIEEAHFINWPEAWQSGVPESANISYYDFHHYFPSDQIKSDLPESQMRMRPYTSGDDVIIGSASGENLFGGGGNDRIEGRKGNDVISGDHGHDTLLGGEGRDSISGGLDNDLIYGGAGKDHIYGGSGDDTIYGGPGNDLIYGGSGHDLIYGGAGNDTLIGSWENETLYGGDGNDVLYAGFAKGVNVTGPAGQTVMHGGRGNDWLYAEANGEVTMTGGVGQDTFVFAKNAQVTITDFNTAVDRLSLNMSKAEIRRQNIDAALREQARDTGDVDMVLTLGETGSVTFLGLDDGDRGAILSAILDL